MQPAAAAIAGPVMLNGPRMRLTASMTCAGPNIQPVSSATITVMRSLFITTARCLTRRPSCCLPSRRLGRRSGLGDRCRVGLCREHRCRALRCRASCCGEDCCSKRRAAHWPAFRRGGGGVPYRQSRNPGPDGSRLAAIRRRYRCSTSRWRFRCAQNVHPLAVSQGYEACDTANGCRISPHQRRQRVLDWGKGQLRIIDGRMTHLLQIT